MKAIILLAFFTAGTLAESGPMDALGSFDNYKLEGGHSEDKEEEWNKVTIIFCSFPAVLICYFIYYTQLQFQAAAKLKVTEDYKYTKDDIHFSRFFNRKLKILKTNLYDFYYVHFFYSQSPTKTETKHSPYLMKY